MHPMHAMHAMHPMHPMHAMHAMHVHVEAGHLERLLAGEIQWAMQRMFQQYDSIAELLLPTALVPKEEYVFQPHNETEKPQPQLNFGE
jgi:hypothetical protein